MKASVSRFVMGAVLAVVALSVVPAPVAAQGGCVDPFIFGESCQIAGYKCDIICGDAYVDAIQCPGNLVYYTCENACPAPHQFSCACTIPGLCG